jgi:hypothetical protein
VNSACSVGVDIVVNNHNYAEFLAAAVESALGQTHPQTRVICVDDGSTDDSSAILRAYGERVTAILQNRGGQASALNAGFSAVSGDVVIFLDADDVLLPETAAMVATRFALAPNLSKVQYRMCVTDRDGATTSTLKPPTHIPLPDGDVRALELAAPFDLAWVPTSGTAFNVEFLRSVMPIPVGGDVGADWYLTHLAPLWGPVRSLESVGALYRVHGRNAYEPARPQLDIAHIRHTIVLADATKRHLTAFADQLGIDYPATITAVSDVANRLISLKLEPEAHPLRGDRMSGLLAEAVRATTRRFDVGPAMRLAMLCWFVVMAGAPRRLAPAVAEMFAFPERRPRMNRIIARLHRGVRP